MVEIASLTAPLVAHSGATPRLLLLRSRVEKKRERGRDRMEGGLGERGGVPTRRRGRSGRGPPSPMYGCHVVAVGEGGAGASAHGEVERAEREAVGPAAPAPFFFFF